MLVLLALLALLASIAVLVLLGVLAVPTVRPLLALPALRALRVYLCAIPGFSVHVICLFNVRIWSTRYPLFWLYVFYSICDLRVLLS